jgi:hypothetical protein
LISSGVAGATPLDVQEAAVEDEDESAAPSDTLIKKNNVSSVVLLHNFSVYYHHEPNIKVQISLDIRILLRSVPFPQIDHPSKFRYNPWVSLGEICIEHTFVRRTVLKWKAKNDPRRTLCVLTSPLVEVFPVLALLDSARVVLGSSEVPFEFRGAHPELRSGTRFGDESMDNLIVEVQHLMKIQIKR